jgi:hypothetical protein
MRIIETKVFLFNELNEEAKQKAIETIRNINYEYNDFAEWAIDDCSLLEPPHKEISKFKNYDFPLIKNNRKIYFSLDRDRYIDISIGMEIQDDQMFLNWLGIDNRLIDKISFEIGKDTIDFEIHLELTEIQEQKLEKAKEKFEDHCEDILNRIENDIDYRFSDEAIIEDIEANDYEFTEEGKRY